MLQFLICMVEAGILTLEFLNKNDPIRQEKVCFKFYS